MLDYDLARIYGYETRYFNRQVKNNIVKSPADFMFQLTEAEFDEILKCKNFTSSWGGVRKLPFAFSEQGIYMLMSVLKGDLATAQSIALVLSEMRANPKVMTVQLMAKSGLSKTAIQNYLRELSGNGSVKRVGSNKGGHWEVIG